MNKYDRLVHILNILRTRKNMNADSLAEECQVTDRTIYRDIISLSEMNVPIYYDNGYKLASDYFLPPINFSFDEYRLMTTALESTPLIKEAVFLEAYKSLRPKLDNCLSDIVREEKKLKPQTTHVEIPQSDNQQLDETTYSELEDAVTNNKKIRITYESVSSGLTERIVNPYFIIFRSRAFYFVGFCHNHSEFRTFRLDRIKSLEHIDEYFNKDTSVTPQTYFDKSWSIYSGQPVEVTVQFSQKVARVITGSNHHPDEKIEMQTDGSLLYNVTVSGLDEIKRWILGFGGEAKVIMPVELRNQILEIAAEINKTYKQ